MAEQHQSFYGYLYGRPITTLEELVIALLAQADYEREMREARLSDLV
jgi:hypothetical protein